MGSKSPNPTSPQKKRPMPEWLCHFGSSRSCCNFVLPTHCHPAGAALAFSVPVCVGICNSALVLTVTSGVRYHSGPLFGLAKSGCRGTSRSFAAGVLPRYAGFSPCTWYVLTLALRILRYPNRINISPTKRKAYGWVGGSVLRV